MLKTLTSIPLGHLVKGMAATLLAVSLIGPTVAQQQDANAAAQRSESAAKHREQLAIREDILRDRLEATAQTTLSSATTIVAANAAKVDTTTAKIAIAALDRYKVMADSQLRTSIDRTDAAAAAVTTAAAAADRAAAAARALANANTPDGAKNTARSIAASQYGWDDSQFQCLSSLWQKESGWNYQAYNAGSGATGIPQALPGSKMASIGSDWQTNATTQIKWGLDYVSRSYGTPCSAWSHSESVNWY
ncbi:hypothetical protein [Leifsonia poae]|uniref:aggregation-promoting factor C-terminal-like domain-containing protein n=1 Tax=Leifsonia poae TaxID=110933 RepID=UPI001CBD121C|nr:hypothetical protein [Leifsonia poae]